MGGGFFNCFVREFVYVGVLRILNMIDYDIEFFFGRMVRIYFKCFMIYDKYKVILGNNFCF